MHLVPLAVGLVPALSLVAAMLMDVQSRKHGLETLICRARTAVFSFTAEELRQTDNVSAENNQHLYRSIRRELTQLAGPGSFMRVFDLFKKGRSVFPGWVGGRQACRGGTKIF